MMAVERIEQGAVTVLRLEGDIDEDGINVLRVSLLTCIKERRSRVVVNMSDVRYVSFMGLGVLVERLRQLRQLGGDLKLANVNLYTKRVIKMAGASSVFEAFDSEIQAVQGFREAA